MVSAEPATMLPAVGNGIHWELELKEQALETLKQLTSLLSSESEVEALVARRDNYWLQTTIAGLPVSSKKTTIAGKLNS